MTDRLPGGVWGYDKRGRVRMTPAPVKVIRLTAGAPFAQWCDACLRTHAFIHLYNADRPDRPPMAVWGDHGEG